MPIMATYIKLLNKSPVSGCVDEPERPLSLALGVRQLKPMDRRRKQVACTPPWRFMGTWRVGGLSK